MFDRFLSVVGHSILATGHFQRDVCMVRQLFEIHKFLLAFKANLS